MRSLYIGLSIYFSLMNFDETDHGSNCSFNNVLRQQHTNKAIWLNTGLLDLNLFIRNKFYFIYKKNMLVFWYPVLFI